MYALGVLCAISATPLRLPAQDLTRSPLVHQTDQIGGIGPDVHALCPGTAGLGAGELRRLHAARSATRRQARHTVAARIDVACVRLALHLVGNPSIAGDGMQLGTSWVEGAIALLDSVLIEAPASEPAGSLLWLGASQALIDRPPATYDLGGDGIRVQREYPHMASRMVGAIAAGNLAPVVLRGCVSSAIRVGDYASAQWCNVLGLRAGTDSSWHLMRLAYSAALRGDARTTGRLVDHAIMAASTPLSQSNLAWHFVTLKGVDGACRECETGTAIQEVRPERFLLADRAARGSLVEDLHQLAARDTTTPQRPLGEPSRLLAAMRGATGWELRVLAHFGMRSYAAGTFRYCLPYSLGQAIRLLPCAPPPVPREWTAQPIAKSHLLWDQATGSPLELIVYAAPIKQLARTALTTGGSGVEMSLQVMHWSLVRSGIAETTVVRRLRLPERVPGDAAISGVVTLPARDAENWGLHLMQPSLQRGGVWITGRTLLDSGAVRLSDLVLGAEAQGLTTVIGDTLTLGPLDSFDRREPIMLQFQTNARDGAQAVSAMRLIVAEAADGVVGKVMLQTSAPITVGAGIAWQRREVDLSRVAKGSYSLGVELLDANGTVMARRVTMVELR